MSQTETSAAATPGAASLPGVNLPCPTCRDTARNLDAPDIADDGDLVARSRLATSESTAEADRVPPSGQAWPRMSSTKSQTETSAAATPGAASLPSVNLPCPTCRDTARNPDATEIADDGDPVWIVADPVIQARLSAAAIPRTNHGGRSGSAFGSSQTAQVLDHEPDRDLPGRYTRRR